MAEELKVYALDVLGNSYQTMTKEQIYAALQQYIETGKISDIDKGFISKILNTYTKDNIQFWIGSMADFEALETKDPNTLYMFTDDPTVDDFDNALNNMNQRINNFAKSVTQNIATINARLDNLGFKEGVATITSQNGSLQVSVNSLKKQGKYVIFDFAAVGSAGSNSFTIKVPDEFVPKDSEYNMVVAWQSGTVGGISTPSYTSEGFLIIIVGIGATEPVEFKINAGWETN